MRQLIKDNWDILLGSAFGLTIAIVEKFRLYELQVGYSVIILMLGCIAVLRMIRQQVDKHRATKRNKVIDTVIDKLKPVKAISIVENPAREGEVLGKFVLKLWEVKRVFMKKLKTFWDKFKGRLFSIALGVLTIVEMYGGYIDELCGGALAIEGVNIVPLVTLVAALVVGIISNGFTKEQLEKIKELFGKSNTNEIVLAEIKKSLKNNEAQVKELNKSLSTNEAELANLNGELEGVTKTYEAKKEMYNMLPRLATEEDVQVAANAVAQVKAKIAKKVEVIEEINGKIDAHNTTISALKSRL